MRTRRALLAAGAAALAGCTGRQEIAGGFAGASPARGHLLQGGIPAAAGMPVARRAQVVIAGGGIAGLAAARALRQRGIEDLALLDIEDAPGGNSRAGSVGGIACPLGAHYLPVPGDDAPEVQGLLEELGLRRRIAGRWVHDERHLCHSPQERLFFRGRWQEGLLPLDEVGAGTLAQYRRFARLVDAVRGRARFAIPASTQPYAPEHLALDTLTFAQWLARSGLDDPQLRWYLDYCCRDDYGAGPEAVSAWAGLHYFAARHGFHVPGDADGAHGGEREGVFTWPEGNGFLARALAAPLGERFKAARLVRRIAPSRAGVEVDAYDCASGTHERWQAAHCIVALPVFVAARVLQDPPAFLRQRAAHCRYAPWAVANLHLRAPLDDRPGAAPAWDNVIYGAAGLGYVDATHQRLDPRPGPTVLSWYLAPGEAERAALLRADWPAWRDRALAELSVPHPDIAAKCTRVEVARYGHAMAIPRPGRWPPPARRPRPGASASRTPTGPAIPSSRKRSRSGTAPAAAPPFDGLSLFGAKCAKGKQKEEDPMSDAPPFVSVKLSAALVGQARESAQTMRRSVASQIEYWATLGRALEHAGLTTADSQALIARQERAAYTTSPPVLPTSPELDDLHGHVLALAKSGALADRAQNAVTRNKSKTARSGKGRKAA